MPNWIVKNEKKSPKVVPFEERIAKALEEAGIDPKDWTDEELKDWENPKNWEVWEIGQAMRMEHNRRFPVALSEVPDYYWR